jgi:hypothetical protein
MVPLSAQDREEAVEAIEIPALGGSLLLGCFQRLRSAPSAGTGDPIEEQHLTRERVGSPVVL